MEQKIKRLKEFVEVVYSTVDSGILGFWAVGEETIWQAPETEQEDVFFVRKLKGQILIKPIQTTKKITKTYTLSNDTIESLRVIAAADGRSATGEIEWLVEQRFLELSN